jgi:hypothetical protein
MLLSVPLVPVLQVLLHTAQASSILIHPLEDVREVATAGSPSLPPFEETLDLMLCGIAATTLKD